MPPIVIYTKSWCPYCHAAKALLDEKGAAYEEIVLDGDRVGQMEMAARSGGRSTVPQIFIGDKHVGGCDELHDLEAAGELDEMLAE